MTFGFPQTGDASRPAVVPKGSELLLETRLPYLDATQRRVVLKTTAVPSGYPVMDDAEGWGRLNLFAAADGYGRFDGDVAVTMDAAQGGFSALDTWRNDIAGAGKLTKLGSGTLVLAGNNSFTGGIELAAGTLQAGSGSALGNGAVYVGGGTLRTTTSGEVTVNGSYTQRPGSTLSLQMTAAGGTAGTLTVNGPAALAGTLEVNFAQGVRPAVGSTITVLRHGGLNGSFDAVSVPGYRVTPVYLNNAVQLRIDAAA